jgi:hypothetical protein
MMIVLISRYPFKQTLTHWGQHFLKGEDDMGTKEEVKTNFRTPPRRGKLIADWHARTTYDM